MCLAKRIEGARARLRRSTKKTNLNFHRLAPMCSFVRRNSSQESAELAERLTSTPSQADALYKSISGNALSVEQAGEVAQAAGIKTLVLNHFVPGDDSVADRVFLEAARTRFTGEVIAGRDLLEI